MIRRIIKSHALRLTLSKIAAFHRGRIAPNPVEFNLQEDQRILVLAPHPDDESIGFGGGLLKFANRVDVACITDGGRGIPNLDPVKTIEIRHEEFNQAIDFCGAGKRYWLGVEDGFVADARDALFNLPLGAYSHIAAPNWLDTHPDHCAVAYLLSQAYCAGKITNRTNIIFYEVWNALAQPTHFIDLTNLAKRKEALINLYRSQVEQINYSYYVGLLNGYRGLAAGARSAEAYTVVPANYLSWLL